MKRWRWERFGRWHTFYLGLLIGSLVERYSIKLAPADPRILWATVAVGAVIVVAWVVYWYLTMWRRS